MAPPHPPGVQFSTACPSFTPFCSCYFHYWQSDHINHPFYIWFQLQDTARNNLQGLDFICCRSDSSFFYCIPTMVLSCHCIIACSYHIYQQISQLWICVTDFESLNWFFGLCCMEILLWFFIFFSKEMLILENIIIINVLRLMFFWFKRILCTLAHSRTTCPLPILLFLNFLSNFMV